jgi:tight adherence protein B
MSLAVMSAAAAGALAVLAVWELLVAIEREAVLRRVASLLGPLRRAGTGAAEPSAAERRRLAVVGAFSLLAAGWLVAGPLVGCALGAAGPWAMGAVLRARRRRWREGLARGAPVVARALGDALGAGHSIRGALADVAARGGMRGPVAGELDEVAGALALGEPTEVVLQRLRRRAAAPAWDTIVAAILLQREAGGDLAGLLREIADGLEDGLRAQHEARSATAQARFTGALVAGLPLIAVALAELAQPGYLRSLASSPISAGLALAAAVLQVAGLVVIRRLARVRW